MRQRLPLTIDMTPGGGFAPRPIPRATWPLRLGLGAAAIAAVASVMAISAVLLWIASVLIPVALIAGLVAYAAFRWQLWRNRRPLPPG